MENWFGRLWQAALAEKLTHTHRLLKGIVKPDASLQQGNPLNTWKIHREIQTKRTLPEMLAECVINSKGHSKILISIRDQFQASAQMTKHHR